ncbi:MAG: protein-tyrosine phosphatase family protein [Acidobacteriota bacterium]
MKLMKGIVLVILTGSLFFTSCSHYKSSDSINVFPPESTIVNDNGSVPPGFWQSVKNSGIDVDCITCNSQNRYGSLLKSSADDSAVKLRNKLLPFLKELETGEKKHLMDELEEHIMWAMVRGVLIEGDNNNFGLIVLKDRYWTDEAGKKHPLVIFRTAFTPSPDKKDSCYRSILECANVKHVINLYDGDMELDDLIKGERETAALLGATYVRTAELGYGHWRASLRENPEKNDKRDKATKNFARLIKEQILKPGGESPKGNILIHCGGGMHRTGMVIGVLQKVINGVSMEDIAKIYSYHVGYKGKDHQGGFEQGNLDFIAQFPAELLK